MKTFFVNLLHLNIYIINIIRKQKKKKKKQISMDN